jgi:hypothetical protein
MPEQHSKVLGGSSANIMLNCPGSRHQIAKAPPEASSPYAALGTALHNAMDIMVRGEDTVHRYPMDFMGWTDAETGVTLDKNHCGDKLAPMYDCLQSYLMENPVEVYSEVRVAFKPVEDSFGTIDLMIVFDDRIVMLDWKTGDGVLVSPVENTQLMYYAAAALFTPELKDHFKPGMAIDLAICQPTERVDDPLSVWTTDIATLAGFAKRLTEAVVASIPTDAPLVPGDHCRWCKGRVNCPKLKERAEKGILSDPSEVDGEELADLLRLADELDPWIKSVRQYAHEALERGHPVPHWKLVAKRATRQWVDAEAAVEVLSKFVDTDKLIAPGTLRSVPQIEKLFGKAKFKEQCDDLVVAVSSGTTLAPESDKRAAVVPAKAFDSLAKQVKAQNSNRK